VTVMGVKIFGCGWTPGIKSNGSLRPGAPASTTLRYDTIPTTAGIDILVTHGPALGVLDKVGAGPGSSWGSPVLNEVIKRVQPGLHLHGHVKESRGFAASFGKSPLVINSCMADTDKQDCVLYASPTVVSCTRIGEATLPLGQGCAFQFALAPLVI